MGNGLNVTVTGELWGAFLCLMAFVVMLLYREKTQRDLCVRQMLLVCTFLLLSDTATWYFDGRPGSGVRIILYVSNYMLYLCGYLIVACFIWYMWQMVKREGERVPVLFKIFWAGVAISVVALTIGVFVDLYFYFDESNVYHRTDAYIFSQLIAVLGVITLVWATIKYRKRLSRFEIVASCSYFILPPLGTLVQSMAYGYAFQQFAFAVATLVTFYVREADIRDALKKQFDVIGGLSNAYFVCIGGDADKNDYTVYKENEFLHELLKTGECTTVDAAFAKYIPVGIMPEDREKMAEFTNRKTLPERMKNSNVITMEFHGTVPELEWCRASWIAVERDKAGRAHGFLFVMENISDSIQERKAYENALRSARDQAESANRAKTAFLFNMSHDIRTPMNAIIGFTDLAEKHYAEQEKAIGYLHKAQDANRFLLSLINNVLEMARIESGSMTLKDEKIAVEEFGNGIISVFEEEMRKKNLAFTKKFDIQHAYVYGDPVKLREIFLNIISNAYKYTPEGGSIHVDLRELPSDAEAYATYRVRISDTGIGMSEEFLPHVFEEFSRAASATESKIEGTGLGLPIVKRLVDRMGGTIEVESEAGKGSAFTITLSHRIADGGEIREEAPEEMNMDAFQGKRILLAEDNELNAEIAGEILSEAGFVIEHAPDGAACVDMLKQAEPGYYDVILMDIQMPNMNGYEATKVIRSLESLEKKQIPIIAMTANAFDEDKRNAMDAGMDGHVAKPIEVPVLMQTLTDVFRDRSAD